MQAVVRILSVLLIAGTWAGWEVLDWPPVTAQEARSATIAAQRGTWTADVLTGLGNTEPSGDTIAFLEAWHRAEGGTASFNWLNTTQGAAGATMYNCLNPACTIGVKNYPSYEAGVLATVETLTNGSYPNTLAGLQTNQPIVDDAELGVWGTGGAAVRAQMEGTQVEQPPRVSSKCLPTSTGQISAHFNDTNSGYWSAQAGGRHNGTDYSGNQGDPVYAPFAFVVEDVQFYSDPGRIGWYVQGRFDDGYLFYAGHLGTVGVSVGQSVPACTQIGTIGEVFHTHIKINRPGSPEPCEATGCDDFEVYLQEH